MASVSVCLSVCWWNKKLGYIRDSAGLRSLRRSRSFKVTDFGTNRKPVCDFLLVVNTNLHPVSHRFQVITDFFCQKLRFRQGRCLSLIHSFGVNPKLTTTKFGAKKLETYMYHTVQNTFRYLEPFRRGLRVWLTDRRTERQTEPRR